MRRHGASLIIVLTLGGVTKEQQTLLLVSKDLLAVGDLSRSTRANAPRLRRRTWRSLRDCRC
jgi:hypothetical protein